MVMVEAAPDCGNAPRKQVLRDYSVALVRRDVEALLALVADDVEWDIVGRRSVEGRDGLVSALDEVLAGEAEVLRLDAVLTHGKEGAVSGRVDFRGGGRLRFCDVHEFGGHGRSAKIKRITSYWIEV